MVLEICLGISEGGWPNLWKRSRKGIERKSPRGLSWPNCCISSWEGPWFHPVHYIIPIPTFSLGIGGREVADKDSRCLLYLWLCLGYLLCQFESFWVKTKSWLLPEKPPFFIWLSMNNLEKRPVRCYVLKRNAQEPWLHSAKWQPKAERVYSGPWDWEN